jgi:tRNA(Leu) C34 or U34 (ribose-2'-O)-methylase TrmL
VTLAVFADGVENPANLDRIEDAAHLIGATRAQTISGRLIAIENSRGARSVYGRNPLNEAATIAVGNERRGLSRRILDRADETLVIPTLSRTISTLNVAAAAAVAGWYVVRGSAAQALAARPEHRRPALLIVGDDHVEVGSTLRSAAAFGFHDVLLEDRDAGWFEGTAAARREARAAARRHKNPLRIHRADLRRAVHFEEILLVSPFGTAPPLHREPLNRGQRQLVVIGATLDEVSNVAADRLRVATLGLVPMEHAPLRLVASIGLAEIARQVGRRRPTPGRPAPRPPTYEIALELASAGETRLVDPSELIAY